MLARAKTISDQEKFMFFPHLYKWVLLFDQILPIVCKGTF